MSDTSTLAEVLESCLPDDNGEYDDDTPLVLANVIARLRALASVPARSPDDGRMPGDDFGFTAGPRSPDALTEAALSVIREARDEGRVYGRITGADERHETSITLKDGQWAIVNAALAHSAGNGDEQA